MRKLSPYIDDATARAAARYAWQASAGLYAAFGTQIPSHEQPAVAEAGIDQTQKLAFPIETDLLAHHHLIGRIFFDSVTREDASFLIRAGFIDRSNLQDCRRVTNNANVVDVFLKCREAVRCLRRQASRLRIAPSKPCVRWL